jgi:hypothetical protein
MLGQQNHEHRQTGDICPANKSPEIPMSARGRFTANTQEPWVNGDVETEAEVWKSGLIRDRTFLLPWAHGVLGLGIDNVDSR